MRKTVFARGCALAMALILACSVLPFGVKAAEVSVPDTVGSQQDMVQENEITAVEVEEAELSGFASFLYYDLPVILGAAFTTALILLIQKLRRKKTERN